MEIEKMVIEMHGDIKTLVSEFKALNGTVKENKENITKHELESKIYRYRIDITWFILQGIKWALVSGLVWRGFEFAHWLIAK